MRKPPWISLLGLISLLLVTTLPGAAGYQTGDRTPPSWAAADDSHVYLPMIMNPLRAHFSGAPTSDPVPVTVFFTNETAGSYTSSLWSFGDGTTSTETHPIHFYPSPGVYTVALTVSGPGESDTLTRTNYITVQPPLPMVPNGSFERDVEWETLPNGNQVPDKWILEWIEPGDPIFGSDQTATAIPECVHKHTEQLPGWEQRGGPNALILDGDYVYKVFSEYESYGASLTQVITGLTPGAVARLRVPVQVHLHLENDPDPDPWGVESGSWVNDYGQWVNGETMGDRRWYVHEHHFVVPADGKITLEVRFKSKWPLPKDFFIDAVQLELTDAP